MEKINWDFCWKKTPYHISLIQMPIPSPVPTVVYVLAQGYNLSLRTISFLQRNCILFMMTTQDEVIEPRKNRNTFHRRISRVNFCVSGTWIIANGIWIISFEMATATERGDTIQ